MQTVLEHSSYYPNFIENLGLDVDAISDEINAIPITDRQAFWMKYRGQTISHNSKFFYVDDLENFPLYQYPGFQYEAIMREYRKISDNYIIHGLQELIYQHLGYETNHYIGTTYFNESDNIKWHNDKTQSLDTTVPIFTFSFYPSDPALSFRTNPTSDNKNPDKVIDVPLEHGSLFVLHPKTNADYQHALLPVKEKKGKRISVIFRGVATRMPMSNIQKKARNTIKNRK